MRIELGLDSGIIGNSIYDETNFLMTPVLTLEPKWYYNLNKRVANARDINNNSGNFFSIKLSYNPDWFVISSSKNIDLLKQFSIIPSWGIRRNLGKHFNYETGFGIGYRYIFNEHDGTKNNISNETAINLHLRIGYQF